MKASDFIIDDDNYFEIAEAIHTVLTLWHDGRFGYELLCRSQFKPSPSWYEQNVIDENEFYDDVNSLVESSDGKFLGYDEIEILLDNLNEFIDNSGDDDE